MNDDNNRTDEIDNTSIHHNALNIEAVKGEAHYDNGGNTNTNTNTNSNSNSNSNITHVPQHQIPIRNDANDKTDSDSDESSEDNMPKLKHEGEPDSNAFDIKAVDDESARHSPLKQESVNKVNLENSVEGDDVFDFVDEDNASDQCDNRDNHSKSYNQLQEVPKGKADETAFPKDMNVESSLQCQQNGIIQTAKTSQISNNDDDIFDFVDEEELEHEAVSPSKELKESMNRAGSDDAEGIKFNEFISENNNTKPHRDSKTTTSSPPNTSITKVIPVQISGVKFKNKANDILNSLNWKPETQWNAIKVSTLESTDTIDKGIKAIKHCISIKGMYDWVYRLTKNPKMEIRNFGSEAILSNSHPVVVSKPGESVNVSNEWFVKMGVNFTEWYEESVMKKEEK